ncbi:MAG TPA: hypothetical protein VGA56_05635, partial [Opitutaceae bacterium]
MRLPLSLPAVLLLNTTQLSELTETLLDFEERTAAQGRHYLSQGRVGPVDWDAEAGMISARMQDGTNCTATWRWDGRFWETSCTCPVGGSCMHAYALGARALEQLSGAAHGDDAGGAPPQTSRAPEEKLEPMLERLHERPLKPAEKRAVMQLERMYGAYARTGMINMHALIEFARRVNPGLLPSAHREEEFFADVFDRNRPPRGVLEFWEHLAVVFRERGWHIPSLLAPVSNTAALEARIAERRRARELEEWTRKVEQLGNVAPGRPDPVRRTLRLCIAPKALRFQASNADGSFSELGSDEVNALALFSSFAETARKL